MTYRQARNTHLILALVAFPLGVAVAAVLAFQYGTGYVLLAFAWTISMELATRWIKCPECGRPIGFGRFRILGVAIEWWKAIPARVCEYRNEVPEPRPRMSITRWSLAALGWILIALGALFSLASEKRRDVRSRLSIVPQRDQRSIG